MEFSPINKKLDNLVFEDEEDVLKDEKSEEIIEPNFHSENETQELQLSQRKDEEPINLALSYKFNEFQIFNTNSIGNGNEKNVFLARKKNRTKIDDDSVKNDKSNFLKFYKERFKDGLSNWNNNNNDEFLNYFNNEKFEEKKSIYLNNLFDKSLNVQENEKIELNNNFAKKEVKNYINNNINNKIIYFNYFNRQKHIYNNLTMQENDPLIISPSNFSYCNLYPFEYISNGINNFKGINNMTIDNTF